MSDHFDSCFRITSHFPEYFNESSEVNDVNENGNIEKDINRDDDATLNSDLVSNFDKETSLWSHKSVKEKWVEDKRRLHEPMKLCYVRLADGGQTLIIDPLQKNPGLQ